MVEVTPFPRPLTQRNRQVFESEFQVFRRPEPSVQWLKWFCWNHMLQMPGPLVVFPSWILHDVKPFQGEGERITVAFNRWFESQQPTG